jgi:Tfp pilus assembly protein PilO
MPPEIGLYLLTLCLPLATILIVFGMRYFAMIQQAKARLANDDAYRQVAEQSLAVQSASAATLSGVQATLTDVQSRLAAIETILKQVE